MDGLSDEERVKAWLAHWKLSFEGIAIVEKDGTFRSANPQFCKLLDVTPAAIIGKKFQDITPLGETRNIDIENASLAADGLIDSYVLPKKYQFGERFVDVVLLVVRVPRNGSEDFMFFVSKIVLDEATASVSSEEKPVSGSPLQTQIKSIAEFLSKNGKWLAAIGAILGGAGLAVSKALSKVIM